MTNPNIYLFGDSGTGTRSFFSYIIHDVTTNKYAPDSILMSQTLFNNNNATLIRFPPNYNMAEIYKFSTMDGNIHLFIMFSMDSISSLNNVKTYITEASQKLPNAIIYIIANKSELVNPPVTQTLIDQEKKIWPTISPQTLTSSVLNYYAISIVNNNVNIPLH